MFHWKIGELNIFSSMDSNFLIIWNTKISHVSTDMLVLKLFIPNQKSSLGYIISSRYSWLWGFACKCICLNDMYFFIWIVCREDREEYALYICLCVDVIEVINLSLFLWFYGPMCWL